MEFVTDRLTIVVPLGLRQNTEKLPPYQIRRLCMFLIHLAGNTGTLTLNCCGLIIKNTR